MGFVNPFKLYPAFSCWLWIIWIAMFFILEGLGLARVHRMIPLTWFLRDTLPRWLMAGLLGWMFYHFAVVTNAAQPLTMHRYFGGK